MDEIQYHQCEKHSRHWSRVYCVDSRRHLRARFSGIYAAESFGFVTLLTLLDFSETTPSGPFQT